MPPPNILWISFEDFSPRLGCYGDRFAQTPNIDRLAAQGIRYENAFAVAGVCAPSRCSIITGMYPTSIGAHHMRTTHEHPMAPDLPTPYEVVPPPYVRLLPEILRSHGYYTCNNEKTDYQFSAPFTAWDDCSTSAQWRNRPSHKPFFSVFNNVQTHESNMWPDKGPLPKIDPDKLVLPPLVPDTPAAREALARHYENIASNDAWAGQILRELEEDGELENTIIMFWSDHGEGLPRAKRWPYDAGIKVPLIVRIPHSLEAGTVKEDLVSLVDLAPTTLALAGIDPPTYLEGQDFLSSLSTPRSCIFATRDRYDESYDHVRAIRDDRYKYIRNYYPNTPYLQWIPYRNRHPAVKELFRLKASGVLTEAQKSFLGNRPAEELYDTVNDPNELVNLAGKPEFAEQMQSLREQLDTWQAKFDRYGDIPESQMVRNWRPDGIQPQTATPIALALSDATLGYRTEDPLAKLEPGELVQLHCSTQGASIGYRFEEEPWQLYTEPFLLPAHATTLTAKAIRIGSEESAETTYRLG
ncbi:sulfatase [Pelagicoccus sp. SDUM812002]|uniref:sulfatase family protein n=1 Tax=Pelagicoccus sp. SDUM812002 TaxID=3041266 RepID=UPI00280C7E7E|nr:sulfatase [Pelagicoccus sp. SDUM812002]MDQ8186555.1 sulfatase [Pelagicoccus sp. SDUM812002]